MLQIKPIAGSLIALDGNSASMRNEPRLSWSAWKYRMRQHVEYAHLNLQLLSRGHVVLVFGGGYSVGAALLTHQ